MIHSIGGSCSRMGLPSADGRSKRLLRRSPRAIGWPGAPGFRGVGATDKRALVDVEAEIGKGLAQRVAVMFRPELGQDRRRRHPRQSSAKRVEEVRVDDLYTAWCLPHAVSDTVYAVKQ